jgi:hypothetical protein
VSAPPRAKCAIRLVADPRTAGPRSANHRRASNHEEIRMLKKTLLGATLVGLTLTGASSARALTAASIYYCYQPTCNAGFVYDGQDGMCHAEDGLGSAYNPNSYVQYGAGWYLNEIYSGSVWQYDYGAGAWTNLGSVHTTNPSARLSGAMNRPYFAN